MRIGIERAVGVILDGHCRQMLARGAELVHVAARNHSEQRGEGGAGAEPLRSSPQPRPGSRKPSEWAAKSFFDADDQHQIVDSGGDGRYGVEKCRAARRAGRFKPRRRHPWQMHRRGHIRRQMILAGKRRTGEVPQMEGFHLIGTGVGILQRLLARFNG